MLNGIAKIASILISYQIRRVRRGDILRNDISAVMSVRNFAMKMTIVMELFVCRTFQKICQNLISLHVCGCEKN